MISLTFVNLVTPKARAKHEHLFNKSASGLLDKISYLAAALGVTKIISIIVMYCVTLCCPKSDLDVQQTHLC